jgi:hypothetical protein
MCIRFTSLIFSLFLCMGLVSSPIQAKEARSILAGADTLDLILIDPNSTHRTRVSPAFLLAWGKHHIITQNDDLFSKISAAELNLIDKSKIFPLFDARFGIIGFKNGEIVFSMFSNAVVKARGGTEIAPEPFVNGERVTINSSFIEEVTALAQQEYGQYAFK